MEYFPTVVHQEEFDAYSRDVTKLQVDPNLPDAEVNGHRDLFCYAECQVQFVCKAYNICTYNPQGIIS